MIAVRMRANHVVDGREQRFRYLPEMLDGGVAGFQAAAIDHYGGLCARQPVSDHDGVTAHFAVVDGEKIDRKWHSRASPGGTRLQSYHRT